MEDLSLRSDSLAISFLVTTTSIPTDNIIALCSTCLQYAKLLRAQSSCWWKMQVSKLVNYDISGINADSQDDLEWRSVYYVLYSFFYQLPLCPILSYRQKYQPLGHPLYLRIILADPDPTSSSRSTSLLVGEKRAQCVPDALLIRASERGYNDTIVWLLTNRQLSASVCDLAFTKACRNNRWQVVDTFCKLAPRSTKMLERMLLEACANGYRPVVHSILKLQLVDPSIQDNQALISACEYHSVKVLRLLLRDKRVDPTARDGLALTLATERGYSRTIALLTSDPRWK